jgi:predicted ATPase
MRISISGSHLVGKTRLAEALAEALPRYQMIPEPYHLLAEEGHEFSGMPSVEDFELQLERSIQCVQGSGVDVIFDRCPLDILGYLVTHREASAFRPEDWMDRVEESIAELDMVVFVPIEEPDRIAVSPSDARLRAEVDAVLRSVIVDDDYGLGFDVVMTSGSVASRTRQVVARMNG